MPTATNVLQIKGHAGGGEIEYRGGKVGKGEVEETKMGKESRVTRRMEFHHRSNSIRSSVPCPHAPSQDIHAHAHTYIPKI